MKNILITIFALSAVASGTPALSQYQGNAFPNQDRSYQNSSGFNAGGDFSTRIGRLQTRLQAGVQSGAISRQVAGPLRLQLRQLTQLERRYSANGLTGQERADLQQRLRSLRQQIRVADGGGQQGYDQDDQDDYGQNRGNDRSDRNNGRYGDGGYDQDGPRGDAARDSGDQQPPQRGGLGGLLDSVLGGDGLRVGQRAPSNLNGLPSEFRSQYRDGNGVYYRSDGRSIYEIDARSQEIVRVHPMSR